VPASSSRFVNSLRRVTLPGWPQQDLVDGQAAWTAKDERDDLGDVCRGDLGLVVELLDS
jgi:hypothetical protein